MVQHDAGLASDKELKKYISAGRTPLSNVPGTGTTGNEQLMTTIIYMGRANFMLYLVQALLPHEQVRRSLVCHTFVKGHRRVS